MDEHSAGAIIFRQEGETNFYLICKNFRGEWGFPKGHLEQFESTEAAAIREIEEETGITEVTFLPGFEETLSYGYTDEYGRTVKKDSTYFLVMTNQTDTKPKDTEILEYQWLSFEEAEKILTFENTRILLKKAEEFLQS